MDILSKANSIVSEYDQIMQQMMDSDIMLNQDKITHFYMFFKYKLIKIMERGHHHFFPRDDILIS